MTTVTALSGEGGHVQTRSRQVRILVIEDDDDIRSICEHIFAWAGHEVAAALDATNAGWRWWSRSNPTSSRSTS